MDRQGIAAVDRRTPRRRDGDAAEARVAEALRRQGWAIIARQVRVDRDEVDIVALDPGPPEMIVVVEVRSRRSPRFGPQEERLDEAKVRRLYRAMNALRTARRLPDGRALPGGLSWRVDLIAVDHGVGRVRHLRGLIPR
jgi:Holliday junction resolvase-like predicted endonuclease